MRRQQKVNSLRRHYNESNASSRGGNRVHWDPSEPRVLSPTSSTSKRRSSLRSSVGWQRSSVTGRVSTTQSVRNSAGPSRVAALGFDPTRHLSQPPVGLCSKCFEIALWHFKSDRVKVAHHRNLVELVKSAKTCVVCLIFAKQAPVPPPTAEYEYDGAKQIVLSATNRKPEFGSTSGLALDKLIVHLPIVRKQDRRALTLPAQAQLIAGHDSHAAKSGDVIRRRTYGGTNVLCAVNWLAECVAKHEECRKSTDLIGTLMYAVPPRLLDLGTSDNSGISLIETDHNFMDTYVALTYTRGESRVLSTNTGNLAARLIHIPQEKFNKTFKQAISITRLLGFRYLWIDAFCIVMDDPADRTKHVPRMGIIYHNAALTLSAAIAATADEGLITYKPKALPEAKIPYRTKDGVPLGHFHISNYKPRDFHDEVTKGDLNSRAWCLQARALSRRTLHFGRDQLFWECDAGIWSEDCSLRSISATLTDPMVKWRTAFVKYKRARDPDAAHFAIPRKNLRPDSFDLVIPKIYELWYSLVAQYSSRTLPRDKDKSSGIAGLAYVFACLISQRQTQTGPSRPKSDSYVCGLWQNDLPFGLLWSAASFHKWRNKYVKYPTKPRAPSWSWLSVDGALQWPDGVVFSSGSFTGRSFMKVLSIGTHYDRRTDHDFSTLRVRGKIALLSKLYGFRPEDQEWKRDVRERDLAKHDGRIDQTEGPINIPCAMFDSSDVARVWTMLHGIPERPSTGSSTEQTTSTRSQGFFSRAAGIGKPKKQSKVQGKLVQDPQKDFIVLLVIPAGCSQQDCAAHSFEEGARLSATLPLHKDTAFRAQNNCGQGLAYALILYPSSMGEGLFRRVGIAQVRIADFATVERRRDREVVIV